MTDSGTAAADAPADLEQKFHGFRKSFQDLLDEIQRAIVGYDEMLREVLQAVFAGGHVLLEGVPGLGKTYLVKVLSQVLGMEAGRVQCTPDLMPADILGTRIVREDDQGRRSFVFEPGPVFCDVLLADELNRATPKTQAALLEAMQERQVTIGGERRPLPPLFFVLATQNPIDLEGTYPLPEAQLDRFLFKLVVQSPELADLRAVIRRTTGTPPPPLEPVLTPDEVLAHRRLVRRVPLSPQAEALAAQLVHATHPGRASTPAELERTVRFGASPRGAQALVAAARVEALVAGRYLATPADVRAWALPALRHRLILGVEAELEGVDPDALLETLLAHTPDPDA